MGARLVIDKVSVGYIRVRIIIFKEERDDGQSRPVR